MHTHLQKIVPAKNQYRFYSVSVGQTLFGEWAVVKEWGRIGSKGGQRHTEWHASPERAFDALQVIKQKKERRGYVARPEQLSLPL